MRTMIHATDFSGRSVLATQRAATLARETGALLHLVHVVDDDRPHRLVEIERGAAQLEMTELAKALGEANVRIGSAAVVVGDPFEAIVAATEAVDPDLLVVGDHRRRLFRDAFVGTTVERVLRSCACAALVVRNPVAEPYRMLLATTDLGHASIDALTRIADLPWLARRRVLLHVFDAAGLRGAAALGGVPDEVVIARETSRALAALARLAARLGDPAFEPAVRLERLPIAREVIAAAQEHSADLIGLATHARAGLHRMALGSVAGEVLREAPCDVLIVPQKPAIPL